MDKRKTRQYTRSGREGWATDSSGTPKLTNEIRTTSKLPESKGSIPRLRKEHNKVSSILRSRQAKRKTGLTSLPGPTRSACSSPTNRSRAPSPALPPSVCPPRAVFGPERTNRGRSGCASSRNRQSATSSNVRLARCTSSPSRIRSAHQKGGMRPVRTSLLASQVEARGRRRTSRTRSGSAWPSCSLTKV